MRRFAVAALAILIFASPVLAQEQARILKGDTRTPIPHAAPEGWQMEYLPIPPDMLAEFRADPTLRKKTLFIAASYTSLITPNLIAGLDLFDVLPLTGTPYFHGIVLFNFGNIRSSRVKLKATGALKQNVQGTFIIPAGSVVLITAQLNPFGLGLVTFKITANGAKAVFSYVCAGC